MKFIRLIFSLLIICPLFSYADFIEGGEAYLKGDYKSAVNEFMPLAKRGDHRAMYALGSMYSAGHGVEKDLKKAYELFDKAAKNGRADAMYKLGLMYEQGHGVKQNSKKAIRYYQKSAKKGYPLAQYRFGLMYKNGIAVKQNIVNAYAWLVIAGHYFIYDTINKDDEDYELTDNKKRQLLLFQQQEKDKIFKEITDHLQSLQHDMTTEQINQVKDKVLKLSKYRKQYHPEQIKNLKIEPNIQNLFLPETLY